MIPLVLDDTLPSVGYTHVVTAVPLAVVVGNALTSPSALVQRSSGFAGAKAHSFPSLTGEMLPVQSRTGDARKAVCAAAWAAKATIATANFIPFVGRVDDSFTATGSNAVLLFL